MPPTGQASSSKAEGLCPPKLPAESPDQGLSAAEMKLEAITKRLEKEMDAQPKADYFGKTLDYIHWQGGLLSML